ncbi:hypothetical protein GGR42_000050 [Saonia flava]|uniref:Right handed beta helix region n=1 Tax=Saonia flava TaxID=523696 RepID=A0A846QN87_9FLAO|nr:choice-of-anchor Q domain-containing protein [Saonia flava]NJB69588.1 hypothetical protein [Saonia flava]
MQRYLLSILALVLILFWSSCRKDFEYQASIGNLEFSKDTVYLDTVFTNIGSSTYSLKVYNKSNIDIQIPHINLENGENSNYRLNVDGVAGKEFNNIPILAKDSIFIFIETTFDIAPTNEKDFLYTDALQFISNGNTQKVQLVTLIKDAIFLFPKQLSNGTKETLGLGVDEEGNEISVEGFILESSQLTLTNEKAYVVYGYAAVPENETLNINAGARVHFHENSGIIVQNNASIKVQGQLSLDVAEMENEVIFEGDRLEPEFEYIPGQWGTIWLAPGSINNEINHLTIKNATIGILAEGDGILSSPTLTFRNSQIHNSSRVNLWARTASIIGENLVLGNAGASSLYCNLGGSYYFTHATIANYWNNGFRNSPSLLIDNLIETENGTVLEDLVEANFTNCIVDGNNTHELFLQNNELASFNFSFKNCTLKYNESSNLVVGNPILDLDNPGYNSIVLNPLTNFIEVQKNDFRIGEESEVIDKGDTNAAQTLPLDIIGTDRTSSPDIGAYEFVQNK